MTPEQERREQAAIAAEQAAQAQASQRLAVELAAVAAVLLAALLRKASPDVLRTLVRRMLSEIVPAAATALMVARSRGNLLGQELVGQRQPGPNSPIPDEVLQRVIETSDVRAGAHLGNAIVLSTQLPMTDEADVMAVLAKARGALSTQKADAGWVTHRSIALGVAEVARERGRNLVWVAERDACLHCLAYQGHVVAPGSPFPPALTYADKSLSQLGPLLGPPLHPNCRCQLELTDLEPGTLDVGLAREAARSVARGLTDFASEPARIRAADRLVKSATTLLPKSVLERAKRNVRDRKFKARPDSPAAQAEIARRKAARERAAAGPQARPAEPLTGQKAAEALLQLDLDHGPERDALLRYTGGEFNVINGRLRRGDPLGDDYGEEVANLKKLFKPSPVPLIVYRGVRNQADPVETLRGTDPAPISTSLSRKKASQFGDVVEILIPAGTPIIPVSQLQRGSSYRWDAPGNEEEILLPPGTTLDTIDGVLTVVKRRRRP